MMYGMACFPHGAIYFENFEWRGRKNRKGNASRGADQDFFLKNKYSRKAPIDFGTFFVN
jgi:hypothetical protein